MEGPLGPDLLLETSQRPPTVCLWLQHADLASSFISALISICECGSSNVSFGHDRDLHAHLVHASMTVIGLIGPPGAFALNHERLPSKPGAFYEFENIDCVFRFEMLVLILWLL